MLLKRPPILEPLKESGLQEFSNFQAENWLGTLELFVSRTGPGPSKFRRDRSISRGGKERRVGWWRERTQFDTVIAPAI